MLIATVNADMSKVLLMSPATIAATVSDPAKYA